jgi:sulfatase modifying factor 1
MRYSRSCIVWSISISILLLAVRPLAGAATVDKVLVGNAGNGGEIQSAETFGAVAYPYYAGKYEVTNSQYVEFLNGVDPAGGNGLSLYNSLMSSDARGGILLEEGGPEGSRYRVKPGRDNHPVVYVSWYDAVRFANWMHNGQGVGATERGAYTLGSLGNGGVPTNGNGISRNPGALWWLPSHDEWYKAAYHKNDGVTSNYWVYPTSTDSAPFSDQPPGADAPTPSNTANFLNSDNLANGYDDGYAVTGSSLLVASENYLTPVGAYVHAASPYGTFDQGGNVREWNETLVSVSSRVLRGGSWNNIAVTLQSPSRSANSPTLEASNVGFRVAGRAVPEPGALVLVTFLALGQASFLRGRIA